MNKMNNLLMEALTRKKGSFTVSLNEKHTAIINKKADQQSKTGFKFSLSAYLQELIERDADLDDHQN